MWASTATEYPADSFDEKINFGQMLKRQGVKRSARVEALWRDGGVDQVLIFDNPTAKEVKPPILFSEGHALPMGVLPYKEGAIVIEGERLKYLADTNGDNRADEVTLLADGFGAQDTHTGAHGLKYMPGDWVTVINGVLNWGDVVDSSGKMTTFDRTGVAYIRPDGGDFHVVQKGFQNIWGFHLDVEGKTWMHEANNIGYPLAPFYEHFGVPMTTAKELLYRDYMTLYPPLGNVNLEGTSLSGLERSEGALGGSGRRFSRRVAELLLHCSPITTEDPCIVSDAATGSKLRAQAWSGSVDLEGSELPSHRSGVWSGRLPLYRRLVQSGDLTQRGAAGSPDAE
jgi:hypothetical protein